MKTRYPTLYKHVAARFTPGEEFGLHLTVGVALMLACAWAFGTIAAEVLEQSEVTVLDAWIANWFHQHKEGPWTPFMLVITHWHRPAGVLVMAVVFGAWLYRRGAHYWLATLVLAVPGGMLLNILLKYSFQRARPSFAEPLVTLTTYSFPSGHASGATFFYGLLAAYILCTSTSWPARIWAVAVAVVMVALVAFSRVYLGAHYLTDVIAAVVEGVAWLAICITGMSTLRRRHAARLRGAPD